MKSEQEKRLRRKVEDYLRKYCTFKLLVKIAALCGIKTED